MGREAQSVYRLPYGLDGPGIESRWEWGGTRFTAPVQIGPGAHPGSYTMGSGSLRGGGESGRAVALTTHPHLAPRLKKEWLYTSTPPLGLHGLLG